MDAGKRKDLITFQTCIRVPDGGGGHIESWENLPDSHQEWAEIKPLSAKESLKAGSIEALGTFEINIRRRDDLNSAMRILWAGAALEIIDMPRPSAGTAEMIIIAKEFRL